MRSVKSGRKWHVWLLCCTLISLCLGLLTPFGTAQPIVVEHLLSTGSGAAISQATEEIVELFNASQDKIQVKVTYVGGNYLEQLILRVAAGDYPDVLTSSLLGEIGGLGLALPLDDFIERDNLRKQFVPSALEHSIWDGQLIQLPQYVQPVSTYYNQTLFQKAGVENPWEMSRKGVWNWETMAKAARAITKDANGDGVYEIWGMSVRAHEVHRVGWWLSQAGGYFFDHYINPTESRMNTPEVALAYSFLHSLVHETNTMPLDAAITTRGMPYFSQHNVGMIFEGVWAIGYMRTQGMPDEEWDIATLPKGPVAEPTYIHIGGLQISRGSKNPEAAWEWIKFLMTNREAGIIAMKHTGRPSAYIPHLSLYTDAIVVQGRPANTQVLIDAMLAPSSMPVFPIVANEAAFNRALGPEVQKYFRNQQSLSQMQQNIHTQFEALLSEIRPK
ncbi:MAG TPA: sugar ABC transporter substrate-binding protein [Firmicutes bacterium]|jgi:multiple sugar transport system substrate-binding protein|nr:sugar ABC transporter substrate-binding protein [Bacillota bacterium]